jgi:nucleoside-diphosphate kinase
METRIFLSGQNILKLFVFPYSSLRMSLVIIKPDAFNNQQIGQILERFERKKYTMEHMRILKPSSLLVEEHYSEHKDRPFFPSLCSSFHDQKVLVVWMTHSDLKQEEVVTSIRKLVGSVDQPGTIRGDFGKSFQANSIHASDSVKSADREYNLWFSKNNSEFEKGV